MHCMGCYVTNGHSRKWFNPMSDKIPFREMNKSLRIIEAEVGIVLGFEGILYDVETYAYFLGLIETGKMMTNPTRTQRLAQLAAWFKYYQRVIDQMPTEHPMRSLSQAALNQIMKPYEGKLP